MRICTTFSAFSFDPLPRLSPFFPKPFIQICKTPHEPHRMVGSEGKQASLEEGLARLSPHGSSLPVSPSFGQRVRDLCCVALSTAILSIKSSWVLFTTMARIKILCRSDSRPGSSAGSFEDSLEMTSNPLVQLLISPHPGHPFSSCVIKGKRRSNYKKKNRMQLTKCEMKVWLGEDIDV